MAFSMSFSASASAFLQSIMPAPVRSRRALTSFADISVVLTMQGPPLRVSSLSGSPEPPQRPWGQTRTEPARVWPPERVPRRLARQQAWKPEPEQPEPEQPERLGHPQRARQPEPERPPLRRLRRLRGPASRRPPWLPVSPPPALPVPRLRGARAPQPRAWPARRVRRGPSPPRRGTPRDPEPQHRRWLW